MLKHLLKAREDHNAHCLAMRVFLDGISGDLTADQDREYAAMQVKQKQLDAKVRLLEADDIRETQGALAAISHRPTDRTWLERYSGRNTWTDATAGALQKFAGWMQTGKESFLEGLGIPQGLQAGLSSETDPDGGMALPPIIQDHFEKRIREISPIRQIAKVWPTTDAHPRFLIDNNGTASGWVGESDGRLVTASPKLQGIDPIFGEIYANCPATQWLLDDWTNAATWLEDSIVEEFAVQEGAAFVSGNGVTKPRGFLTYPTSSTADATRADFTLQYVPTGAASAFIAATAAASPADCLIDTVAALKPGYRQGAVWVMNRATLATIRKFKDASTGQFIVQRNLETGAPENLLGFPVVEAEDMDALGANKFPIAFGNFQRGYVIVDRQMQMIRDPYTNKPNVNFYGTKRVAGNVLNFDALKLVKCATS